MNEYIKLGLQIFVGMVICFQFIKPFSVFYLWWIYGCKPIGIKEILTLMSLSITIPIFEWISNF